MKRVSSCVLETRIKLGSDREILVEGAPFATGESIEGSRTANIREGVNRAIFAWELRKFRA